MLKKSFLLLAVITAFVSAHAKPVGLWQGYSSIRLQEQLRATVFNPQWTNDRPKWIDFAKAGKDFNKCSVILYIHGGRTPLRFREWDKATVAKAETFVQNGGTIIIWGDRGLRTNQVGTGLMEKLLGAKRYSDFKGAVKFNCPEWEKCGKDPYVFKHMLTGPALALTQLTTAKGLVGNESGYVVTVNNLGKGKVYYVNICLTESLPPYKQPYSPTYNAALEQLFPFVKQLYNMIAACKPDMDKTPRERWDFKPLGPKSVKTNWKMPKIRKVTSNRKLIPLAGNPLSLVVNGKGDALVIGGRVGDLGAYKTLNEVLKKMSGGTIHYANPRAIVKKNGKWMYRGKPYSTLIKLQESADFRVKAEGDTIIISGPKGRIGMAMQTFMREFLDYWMLWPGKDGEHIVETKNISIKPVDFSDAPVIQERSMRNTLYTGPKVWKKPDGTTVKVAYSKGVVDRANLIGFDPVKAKDLQANHRDWWAVQRLGGGINLIGGCSFYSWDKKYGKKHPEYFALQFTGTRTSQGHVRICKSNPDVIKLAAKEAIDALKKRPNAKYYALSPSDGGYEIFCMCPNCRSWDPSDGPTSCHRVHLANGGTRPGRNRPVFPYVAGTDRVLRFTTEVAKLVNKELPDVSVMFLAYSSYETPPLYFRETPKNMLTSFVGLEYLNHKMMVTFRKNWNIWAGLSSAMRLRPNFLLGGQGMPMVYVTEMGKDIKHCAATGMISADFDSVPHHWATMGINYFVLAQMLWDPTLNVEDLVDLYCRKGFGPAAEEMKEYYSYCEKLTSVFAGSGGSNIKELEDLTLGSSMNFHEKALAVYTPTQLAKLEAILDRAKAKVTPGTQFAARLEFVRAGFEFSKKRTEFWTKYYATKDKKTLLPMVEDHVNYWHETFEKYPFAVNIPSLAIGQYFSFWRNCRWKAGAPR